MCYYHCGNCWAESNAMEGMCSLSQNVVGIASSLWRLYKLLSSCSVWSRTRCIPKFSSFACDRLSAVGENEGGQIYNDKVTVKTKTKYCRKQKYRRQGKMKDVFIER